MTEQTEQNAPEGVQLQIADLQALLQVVDILSSRGAVRPEEMTPIGAVRDKLANFLASVASAQQAEAEPEAEGAEPEAEAAE